MRDYEALAPGWNRGKPKWLAFLRLILSQPVQMMEMLDSYTETFSIDTAVGRQLDMLGEMVGASRVLPFAPATAPRRLADEDYRLLIRATVAQNAWDGTNESASAIFGVIFPALGIVLEDKQDMSINVIIRGTLTKIQAEMINAGLLIPHPAGVTMTYEIPETLVSTDIIVQAGIYQAGQIVFTSISAE